MYTNEHKTRQKLIETKMCGFIYNSHMFRIHHPDNDKMNNVVFPQYLEGNGSIIHETKSITSELTNTLELFSQLGSDGTKNYYWEGTMIPKHLYLSYLFRKYHVNCKLNIIKTSELNKALNYSIYGNERFKVYIDESYMNLTFRCVTYKNKEVGEKFKEYDERVHPVFAESIIHCLKKRGNNEIIPLPVSLLLPAGGHSNLLIFRKGSRTMEVFEPHGKDYDHHDKKLSNQIREKYESFAKLFNDLLKTMGESPYKLMHSELVCPQNNGLQNLEASILSNKKRTESGGYCALWSLFMCEMVLMNPHMSTKDIIRHIISYKRVGEIASFLLSVARGMTERISEKLQKYFKVVFKHNITTQALRLKGKRILGKAKQKIYEISKHFRIFILLEYELYASGKTVAELLQYYESIDVPKPKEKKSKHLVFNPNFDDEDKIHNAKKRILKNMLNMSDVTPIAHLDSTMAANLNDAEAQINKNVSSNNNANNIPVVTNNNDKKNNVNNDNDALQEYLLSEKDKKCKTGYMRSRKNKRLCIRRTQKQTSKKGNDKPKQKNNNLPRSYNSLMSLNDIPIGELPYHVTPENHNEKKSNSVVSLNNVPIGELPNRVPEKKMKPTNNNHNKLPNNLPRSYNSLMSLNDIPIGELPYHVTPENHNEKKGNSVVSLNNVPIGELPNRVPDKKINPTNDNRNNLPRSYNSLMSLNDIPIGELPYHVTPESMKKKNGNKNRNNGVVTSDNVSNGELSNYMVPNSMHNTKNANKQNDAPDILKRLKMHVKRIMDNYSVDTLGKMTRSGVLRELKEQTAPIIVEKYKSELKLYIEEYAKVLLNSTRSNKNHTERSKRFGVVKEKRTRKVIDMKPGRKRCPKGFKKYKTGKCYKYLNRTTNQSSMNVNTNSMRQTVKTVVKLPAGRKRCPKGFRKNAVTGMCEK
jgi:hypothetical protein